MSLFWGVPAIGLAGKTAAPMPEGAKMIAVWLCVLAVVGISLGFGLMGGVREAWRTTKPAGGTIDRLPRIPIPILAIWIAWNFFAATGKTLIIPGEFRYVAFLLGNPLPLLVYFSLYAVRTGARWQLWLYVTLLSTGGAISGFLSGVASPIIAAVFLLWFLGGGFRVRYVLVLVALYVFLQPAKSVYRSKVWDRADRLAKGDAITGLSNWGEAVQIAWSKTDSNGDTAGGAFERLDELSPTTTAVAYCPALVPHNEGQVWMDVVSLLVPRLLWPSKPSVIDSTHNRFQITFKMQTREMAEVSTGAFPLPADGWWNFGWLGVALPSLLIGLLYGYLCRAIGTHTWARLTISTGLMMGCPLTQDIAGILTGWAKLMFVLSVMCIVVTKAFSQTGKGLDSLGKAHAESKPLPAGASSGGG
jgi:hypothetical protein